MAEARVGVRPVPGLGLHYVKVDLSVPEVQAAIHKDGLVIYIPKPAYLFRSTKKRIYQFVSLIATSLYPLTPLSVTLFAALIATLVLVVDGSSWLRQGWLATLLWNIDSLIPFTDRLPTNVRVGYLAILAAVGACILVRALWRWFLCLLLQYHGWLFEERGQISLATKLWSITMKTLYFKWATPRLFSFQGALPRLPVPKLHDTVEKILASTKPILNPKEHQELTKLAESFTKNEGPQVQKWLTYKSWLSDNYVTDWWLRFAYLRGRTSLLINSNYYGIGPLVPIPLANLKLTAQAAAVTHKFIKQCQLISTEQLAPSAINGIIPLCMKQYDYAFSSCRIPGREEDRLQQWDSSFGSRHIIVVYRGVFYRVELYRQMKGRERLLSPWQLQEIFQGILEHKVEFSSPQVGQVAALTTMNRTEWSDIREEYFSTGLNRQTLEMVERSVVIVHLLDDVVPREDLSTIGNKLFTYDGTKYWLDKCFQLVFFSNAIWGIHAEHSWGDAPVISHVIENVDASMNWDVANGKRAYGEDGLIPKSEDDRKPPAAQALQWHITAELREHITRAVTDAQQAIANIDLCIREHNDYGKYFMTKQAKCSPDAYVQMALQATYYKLNQEFAMTYESSMTRMYSGGRTETIRACSDASCDFVKTFFDPTAPDEQKYSKLHEACEYHHTVSREAMIGKGCDRHMFAMYVVAKGKGIEAPFLDKAMKIPWRLSTSQVPQRQNVSGFWPGNDMGDNYHSPSGGFGPVADDGYGVCYAICGGLRVYFHVSSKRAYPSTDSKKFMDALFETFAELKSLVSRVNSKKPGDSGGGVKKSK